MKLWNILGSMYSSRLIKESFIVFEITILLILANFVLSPFVRDLKVRNMIVSHVSHQTIYNSPSSLNANVNRIPERKKYLEDEICKIPGLIGQGRVAEGFGKIGERQTMLYFYNDDMFRYASLPLSVGKWGSDSAAKGAECPVYIGGPLKDQYDIGAKLTVRSSFFDYISGDLVTEDIQCIVVGQLSRDDFYYHLGTPGSNPTLGVLGRFQHEETLRSVGQDDGSIMIIANCWDRVPEDVKILNRLLFFDDSTDIAFYAEKLQRLYPQLGSFTSLDILNENQWEYTRSSYQFELIILILLLPLTILGIGGYTVLMIVRKQREIALYYLCGMSFHDMLVANLASKCILIVPPFILSLALSLTSSVRKFFSATAYEITWIQYAIGGIFALVVLLASTLLGAYRIRKIDIICLLRKGD